jgi:sigma-B regulation protein RsbU (phosphoserine phosphatase)
MNLNPPPRLEAKLLYRRLDSLLGGLDRSRPARRLLESFLDDSFAALKDDLHLRAALLYSERRDGFQLVRATGEATPAAEILDATLPPLALVLRHTVYVFGDPEADDNPHRFALLPVGPAAALVVGRRPSRHIFFFRLGDGWVMEEIDFVLNTLRAALGSRLMEERMRGRFREAAEIQQSLLDEEPPAFPGYDIACRSVAAEEVGGDFFDFYPFGPDLMGFAIGDASGHGLPAALLVRDVVTGLRMGIEKNLQVTYVFSKLNRVIHRSALSSRFVSVFYGELEQDGGLIYCNAGHQPPLLIAADQITELTTGGTVIGPLSEARFRRGFVRVPVGGLLVLCTDGILERRDRAGEFFGIPGLEAVARAKATRPAAEILEAIFTTAFDYGDGRPWEDDATAVILRRLDGVAPHPVS